VQKLQLHLCALLYHDAGEDVVVVVDDDDDDDDDDVEVVVFDDDDNDNNGFKLPPLFFCSWRPCLC
jgi:hypothetical protein